MGTNPVLLTRDYRCIDLLAFLRSCTAARSSHLKPMVRDALRDGPWTGASLAANSSDTVHGQREGGRGRACDIPQVGAAPG